MPKQESEISADLKPFVDKVAQQAEDANFGATDYGHAAATLALAIRLVADARKDAESQRALMITQVKKLIGQYGRKIIPFLKDELQLVIDEEKL